MVKVWLSNVLLFYKQTTVAGHALPNHSLFPPECAGGKARSDSSFPPARLPLGDEGWCET